MSPPSSLLVPAMLATRRLLAAAAVAVVAAVAVAAAHQVDSVGRGRPSTYKKEHSPLT